MNYCAICKMEDGPKIAGQSVDSMVFFLNDKLTPRTEILQCPTCGYAWLYPSIDAEELAWYYANQSRLATETIAYKEQMAFLERFIKFEQVKAALDVGSFDGRLLNLIALAGAQKTNAVEPDTKYSGGGFRTLDDA